jgi:acyl-CoA oxidase
VQTHLLALATAHVERVVLESASDRVATLDATLREPLDALLDLYALSRIEDDLAWFLENNYLEPTKSRAIRKEVDALCAGLRPNAVALANALNTPTRAPIAM